MVMETKMKLVILLGDGMADHPIEELGGKTPLEAAETPNMDRIARDGWGGLARNVPPGMPPGSDIANLSVMGYDPKRYYTGRAPLEAAAMGVPLGPEDVAFRCNLVTVDRDRRIMVDYSAGHISSEEGRELIEALRKAQPAARLHPGVSYRNLLVQGGDEGLKAVCTPPHDITGQQIDGYLPKGEGSAPLRDMMASSVPVLEKHPLNLRRANEGKRPANMIWLWGQGKAPSMPKFRGIWGIEGAVISAVDLLKGMGVYAGLEVINVPGATGVLDTDYEGKVAACLDALDRVDFVFLHVEAPDEMSHDGLLDGKIEAIRRFDERIVGPVLAGLERSDHEWRVLVLPDHPTPLSIRTHTDEPVPFAMIGSGIEPDGMKAFSEREGVRGGCGTVDGWRLMGMLSEKPIPN
ncbi:MAG: 2,3-bisphosphoglycerate-independent phosphoglycerate mutase [Methanothrix sp.]|nr:MAG: 2,3-bisphosphoglycerate-independent phosphoglycerate mutase [Methanothrix sp.]